MQCYTRHLLPDSSGALGGLSAACSVHVLGRSVHGLGCRRKRRELLAAVFEAWRLRAGLYKQVSARFQASLQVTLQQAWQIWRSQVATRVSCCLRSSARCLPVAPLSVDVRLLQVLNCAGFAHQAAPCCVAWEACWRDLHRQDVLTVGK